MGLFEGETEPLKQTLSERIVAIEHQQLDAKDREERSRCEQQLIILRRQYKESVAGSKGILKA